jgi:hypothetical protein
MLAALVCLATVAYAVFAVLRAPGDLHLLAQPRILRWLPVLAIGAGLSVWILVSGGRGTQGFRTSRQSSDSGARGWRALIILVIAGAILVTGALYLILWMAKNLVP